MPFHGLGDHVSEPHRIQSLLRLSHLRNRGQDEIASSERGAVIQQTDLDILTDLRNLFSHRPDLFHRHQRPVVRNSNAYKDIMIVENVFYSIP